MKLDHAQTILNRINRMFADVTESGSAASALERDLLKEYVRRLYESLTEESIASIAAPGDEALVESPKKKTLPPVAEIRRPKATAPIEKPVLEKALNAQIEVPKKPRMIEIPADVEADIQEIQARAAFKPAQVAVDNTATMIAPAVLEKVATASPFTPRTSSIPSEISAIFEMEKSHDLSEKLAGAPITDLSRSMAINERLLAQNDLFGGDKAQLDAALLHLNTLNSYEDATAYLGGGAAIKFEWAHGERKATARAFAKLVRRRYS